MQVNPSHPDHILNHVLPACVTVEKDSLVVDSSIAKTTGRSMINKVPSRVLFLTVLLLSSDPYFPLDVHINQNPQIPSTKPCSDFLKENPVQ